MRITPKVTAWIVAFYIEKPLKMQSLLIFLKFFIVREVFIILNIFV